MEDFMIEVFKFEDLVVPVVPFGVPSSSNVLSFYINNKYNDKIKGEKFYIIFKNEIVLYHLDKSNYNRNMRYYKPVKKIAKPTFVLVAVS